jgi:hypothetical protein
MKQALARTILTLAVVAAAGCAMNESSGWSFRYEDRDKIADAAAKIESVAAGLQELALRPESYLKTTSMYMAGAYDTKAADTIRFFATEAGRFHRSVLAWKPDGNLGLDYSSLVKQWSSMQSASAQLMSSEKMRVKIETLNAMMIDLNRLAGPGAGPAKVVTPAPAPATR